VVHNAVAERALDALAGRVTVPLELWPMIPLQWIFGDTSNKVIDTASLAGRFFADVQTNFSGQIIVLENEDPPDDLDPGTRDIAFTKNPDHGRYGLFPHNPTSAEA
jgi:hypothetical protein